jgi:hypothetical protein
MGSGIMTNSYLMLCILGLIDMIAGAILFFITDMGVVQFIALILIIKGLYSVLKCIFKF